VREGKAVTQTPKERLAGLREKIERQRLTVDTLKRDGHVYDDAERELRLMLAELQGASASKRPPERSP
jgi:hypothetical protein